MLGVERSDAAASPVFRGPDGRFGVLRSGSQGHGRSVKLTQGVVHRSVGAVLRILVYPGSRGLSGERVGVDGAGSS